MRDWHEGVRIAVVVLAEVAADDLKSALTRGEGGLTGRRIREGWGRRRESGTERGHVSEDLPEAMKVD